MIDVFCLTRVLSILKSDSDLTGASGNFTSDADFARAFNSSSTASPGRVESECLDHVVQFFVSDSLLHKAPLAASVCLSFGGRLHLLPASSLTTLVTGVLFCHSS